MQPTVEVPTLQILASQRDLTTLAREVTGDVNEAGMAVHEVMSRAFLKYRSSKTDLSDALVRDLRAVLRRSVELEARI
jgi:hypothetical protein